MFDNDCSYESEQLIGDQSLSSLSAIQYWSQDSVPDEIMEAHERWNELFISHNLPKFTIYSKKLAREWIAEYEPSLLLTFDTAFHYTVESDVFRLAQSKKGHIFYVDVDCEPNNQVPSLIQKASDLNSSLLFWYHGRFPSVASQYFYARPDCWFFEQLRSKLVNMLLILILVQLFGI